MYAYYTIPYILRAWKKNLAGRREFFFLEEETALKAPNDFHIQRYQFSRDTPISGIRDYGKKEESKYLIAS
jgi:hypothetical protein